MISVEQTRYWWSERKGQPIPRGLVLIAPPKPAALDGLFASGREVESPPVGVRGRDTGSGRKSS